jgi:hypothetical protein
MPGMYDCPGNSFEYTPRIIMAAGGVDKTSAVRALTRRLV